SGCFEYGNYHYDYTHICASAQVGKNGQCVTGSNSVTYSEAEEICTNKGARLCSMTELRYNVAAGTGCDVEDNLIWTLTSCDNGHVAQGGTLVGSRKGGLEAGCKKDSQTAGVVCCSSDRDEDKCVSEAAKECSSNDGSHSCCDDRKYTYNPVPCTADMDCQACVEPTPDMNGHGQCVDRVYYKKMEISGSKQGFMCCNSEPNQVKCESGYCSLAPCSGGKEQDSSGDWTLTFMSPAWTNVRGDEWSRAHCKACHGNGCDQCDDGYFKYSQKAECLLCDAIDGCSVYTFTSNQRPTNHCSAYQRTANQCSADERTANQCSADERTADERTANQCSDDQLSADQCSADQRTANQCSADKRTANERSADERTANQCSADERTANQCSADERTANQAATNAPPTNAPPTNAPPTSAPPTNAPPTSAPPTNAPPTNAPPTNAPPTSAPPTNAPPTSAPPTNAPPTNAPPT
ncbi:Early nodulin-12B, partial [Diplonema papillatum]